MFIDCMRFRGYIFYVINVVGGVVNCKGVIYGGANVIALTRAFWFDKIKSTMVGLIQRRPTTFRRTGEMSRWCRLCMRRYVLGYTQWWVDLNILNCYGLYILYNQRCWYISKLNARHNWREDIVTPYVVTYAVTLQRVN